MATARGADAQSGGLGRLRCVARCAAVCVSARRTSSKPSQPGPPSPSGVWGFTGTFGTGGAGGDFGDLFDNPVRWELDFFRNKGAWRFGTG